MDEDKKADLADIEKIVANYRALYGHKLEAVLVELLREMAKAGDGNGMLLLQEQLVEAVKIIREKIGAVDMVVLSDADEKKKMN